ncbi:glutathione S-transferase N-terminal domain-containing protein [Candidatus Micrarchaeota archaeon]|nr:glutathione S-transferase N-terminal domain-containing protein [Candidatus Micrarchaeota archaeon]
MAKSVTVYSAEWCPWCHKVMDFLKENNVKFEVKDVDDGENAKECMEKSGQGGIPVTIIDGEAVVGFDTAKLKVLLNLK